VKLDQVQIHIPAGPRLGSLVLETEDLRKGFGDRLLIEDLSFSLPPAGIVGVIGPNGAGKTTLFNVICGLQGPDHGSVTIGEQDITRLAPFKRARHGLARTFQRLELFGLLTVHENVRLAGHVAGVSDPDGRATDLLLRLGIADLAAERADRLPTGQARVVELARALATDPTVLLLDEPASGQDDRETARFSDVLREVAGDGVAVVLVEHDIQLVMDVCSRIHVLDLGRVLATGTPDEIRRDDAVLTAYLGQVS
jgi:branched-chain amino acid transport system ATP-binding protein